MPEEGLEWQLETSGAEKTIAQFEDIEKKLHKSVELTDKEVKNYEEGIKLQKKQNASLSKEVNLRDEVDTSTGDVKDKTKATGASMADLGRKVKGVALQLAGMVGAGLSIMWLVSTMIEQFDLLRLQVSQSIKLAVGLGFAFDKGGENVVTFRQNVAILRGEVEELIRASETYGLFGDPKESLTVIEGIIDSFGMMGDKIGSSLRNVGESITDIRKMTVLMGIDTSTMLTQVKTLIDEFGLGISKVTEGIYAGPMRTVADFYARAKKYVEGTRISWKAFVDTLISAGPQLLASGATTKSIMSDIAFLIRRMPQFPESIGLQEAVGLVGKFRDLSLEYKIFFAKFLKPGAPGLGPFELAAVWTTAPIADKIEALTSFLQGKLDINFSKIKMLSPEEMERLSEEERHDMAVQQEALIEKILVLTKDIGLSRTDVVGLLQIISNFNKEGIRTSSEEGKKLLAQMEEERDWAKEMLEYEKPILSILKDYIGGWLRSAVKYLLMLYHIVKAFILHPAEILTPSQLWGRAVEDMKTGFTGMLAELVPTAHAVYPGLEEALKKRDWTFIDLLSASEEEFNDKITLLADDMELTTKIQESVRKRLGEMRKEYQKQLELPVGLGPTGLPPDVEKRLIEKEGKIPTGLITVTPPPVIPSWPPRWWRILMGEEEAPLKPYYIYPPQKEEEAVVGKAPSEIKIPVEYEELPTLEEIQKITGVKIPVTYKERELPSLTPRDLKEIEDWVNKFGDVTTELEHQKDTLEEISRITGVRTPVVTEVEPERETKEKISQLSQAIEVWGGDKLYVAAIRMAERGKKGNELGVKVWTEDFEKEMKKEFPKVEIGTTEWQIVGATLSASKWWENFKEKFDYSRDLTLEEATRETKNEFVDYMKKYAPIGAKDDPLGLNKNWVPNVMAWYARLDKMMAESGANTLEEFYKGIEKKAKSGISLGEYEQSVLELLKPLIYKSPGFFPLEEWGVSAGEEFVKGLEKGLAPFYKIPTPKLNVLAELPTAGGIGKTVPTQQKVEVKQTFTVNIQRIEQLAGAVNRLQRENLEIKNFINRQPMRIT